MNEVIKQMQKRIVEGIQLPDEMQKKQLRKDVEQALQESIKDLAEHGGGPQAEDRFWKRLEKIIADESWPPLIQKSVCRNCSYFEFCYSKELEE